MAKFYRDLFVHGSEIGEAAVVGDGGQWSHVQIEIGRIHVRDIAFDALPIGLRVWSNGVSIQLVAIRGAHGSSDALMYFDTDRDRWIVTDVPASSPQAVACWHDGSSFWLLSQVDSFTFVRFRPDQVDVSNQGGRVFESLSAEPIPNALHGAAGIRQILPTGEVVWNHSPEGGRAFKVINGIRYLLPTMACEVVVGSVNERTEGVHLRTGERFLVDPHDGHDVRIVCVGGRYRCVSWMPGLGGFDVDMPPFTPITTPEDPPMSIAGSALPAWPRKLWLSAYKSFGVPGHGDSPDLIGNAVMIENGSVARALALGLPLIVNYDAPDATEALGSTIAWFVHNSRGIEDLGEDVDEAMELPEAPIIAYHDGRDWPEDKPAWVNDRVWPCVQCYRGQGDADDVPLETLEEYEQRVGEVVRRVASYGVPFALTVQAYDRNGATSEAHALSTLAAVERWTRDYPVVALLLFADLRNGGMKDHEQIREWAHAATRAIPLRPSRFDYWQTKAGPKKSLANKLRQDIELFALDAREKAALLSALDGDPEPPPPPPPDEEPIPFPPEVRAVLDRYVRQYPVPEINQGESIGDFEERARQWTIRFAEQVAHDVPSPGMPYGVKRSSSGNPISKDSLAQDRPTRLVSWDLLIGTGTGHPEIADDPAFHDITGQVFVSVNAIDHLSEA